MAGKGGKRAGAGRKRGVPNKTALEVRVLAQEHGEAAITELAALMKHSEASTRMAACKEMLDRAYGKAPQAQIHEGNPERPVIHKFIHSFESGI